MPNFYLSHKHVKVPYRMISFPCPRPLCGARPGSRAPRQPDDSVRLSDCLVVAEARLSPPSATSAGGDGGASASGLRQCRPDPAQGLPKSAPILPPMLRAETLGHEAKRSDRP